MYTGTGIESMQSAHAELVAIKAAIINKKNFFLIILVGRVILLPRQFESCWLSLKVVSYVSLFSNHAG